MRAESSGQVQMPNISPRANHDNSAPGGVVVTALREASMFEMPVIRYTVFNVRRSRCIAMSLRQASGYVEQGPRHDAVAEFEMF